MKLQLEINESLVEDTMVEKLRSRGILVSPPVGRSDYWKYRVAVGNAQAIIGFPKFLTIGIGFLKEEDWNTNLPFTCNAEEIYQHIKHNKTKGPKKSDCLAAIRLIQEEIKNAQQT